MLASMTRAAHLLSAMLPVSQLIHGWAEWFSAPTHVLNYDEVVVLGRPEDLHL